MLDKSVTREGTMLIKGGIVYLDGWEIAGGGMCREVAALACLYVAQQLQERGLALIAKPGGDHRTVSDMPSDTPREWLCDKTLAFLSGLFMEVGESPPAGEAIYIASRASVPERPALWRKLRDQYGAPIISSWIDEAGPGETEYFDRLWLRIADEVSRCTRLVLYVEADDFPLKGALIETGMALALHKPVWVIGRGVTLDGRTHRPLGSWIRHPNVEVVHLNVSDDDIRNAVCGAPV